MAPRRSDPSHAGRMCVYASDTHVCVLYARYVVTNQHMLAVGKEGIRACGSHLPHAVRDMWKTTNQAAVVQEVPGMWRDLRDDKIKQKEAA